MEELYEHVRRLSAKHRGAGTREEAEAREYIVRELERMGYKPLVDYFHTPPTFSYTYITIYSMIALAPLACLLGYSIIAYLLALAGLTLLIVEEELYIPVLTKLWGRLFNRKSANIVVRVGDGPRLFVLMAHYDSTKAAYSFNPRRVGYLRLTIILNFTSSTLVSLLTLASCTTGLKVLLIPALVATIPLWTSIAILVHRELFHDYVPGANDNASGVAVLLGISKILASANASSLLEGKSIVIAFTGAEEVGLLGSHRLYSTLGDSLNKAIVINIDNPGAGTLVLTECEGVIVRWCSNPDFRRRLRELSKTINIDLASYQLLPTDATPLMRRGLKATSLMAFDRGAIRNYHWYTDTADGVEVGNLVKAVGIVLDLLKHL